ncbi:ATP-binding protein [Mesonia ostreae]|uniref:DNA polymerase III subunit delta n=1 Tax=Mesonia ostreae TaxID=861110 RepID=A0ABU2KJ21_9FLAO|nr:DNA polymerase III subunit delta' [Mesonia ostreae]MDT0294674.1 DNA polymerase III subunit delta' [Mesonia ostreae]
MLFSEILGLEHIKKHLSTSVDRGRIPHAQLFVGKNGSGTLPMAIAYAQHVLCSKNEREEACLTAFKKLAHPDLHFTYPVANNDRVKKNATAEDFTGEWRDFVLDSPYGSVFDWYQCLGIENKQGNISVRDAQNVLKTLSLKSYEGGYKIMIIWEADKLNTSASNKLLKLIEEPPNNTIFILITENEEQILQTIRSRCQALHFPPLGEKVIATALEKKGIAAAEALKIAHKSDGSYTQALSMLEQHESEAIFETWFITWVRSAFRAKGNKAAIKDILQWSEDIAATGRETQKRFLHYCLDFFRQAMLYNYNSQSLVYLEPDTPGFELRKFAPFVHGSNMIQITEEIEKAIYHIERNVNSKITLADLSIKLTRLLHQKE